MSGKLKEYKSLHRPLSACSIPTKHLFAFETEAIEETSVFKAKKHHLHRWRHSLQNIVAPNDLLSSRRPGRCSAVVWMGSKKVFVEKFELEKAHPTEAGICDFLISTSCEGEEGPLISDTRLTLLSIFGGFSDNFDLDAKLLRMDGSQSYSRWRPSKVYALSFLCEVCVASLGFSNSNKWRKWRKLMELPEVRSCFCYFSGKLLAKWGKLWWYKVLALWKQQLLHLSVKTHVFCYAFSFTIIGGTLEVILSLLMVYYFENRLFKLVKMILPKRY